MGEENRKQGRKGGGRKHGGMDMKRAGKGHKATRRSGTGKSGGLTVLERERAALAEEAPNGRASVSPPATPAAPEVVPRPTSFADLVEQPSVGAAPPPSSPEPAPASPETEALREGVGVRPLLGGGMLAVVAFLAAAVCGLALLRACERGDTPIEDDAVETSSCSDDASLCVAWA